MVCKGIGHDQRIDGRRQYGEPQLDSDPYIQQNVGNDVVAVLVTNPVSDSAKDKLAYKIVRFIEMKMKKIIQTVVAVAVIASTTGCATPYMIDRKRDAADIFTARVGFGAGAKVHIGPIQEGLLLNIDFLGLRGGELIWGSKVPNTGFDGDYLLGGYSEFDTRCLRGTNSTAWNRSKCYNLGYDILGIPVNTPFRCPTPNKYSPSYFTEIEVAGGLLWTFRFGFNPGELLDFALGWFGADIFKDDLEAKKQKEKSNQSSEATPKPGAPQWFRCVRGKK